MLIFKSIAICLLLCPLFLELIIYVILRDVSFQLPISDHKLFMVKYFGTIQEKNENSKNDKIPLLAIEVKGSNISTHDIITYSAKAGQHKILYPWLRYGIIWNSTKKPNIPFRFFKNNKNLDFAYSINEISKEKINDRIKKFYSEILKNQIEIAIKLNEIFQGENRENIEIYTSLIKIKYLK